MFAAIAGIILFGIALLILEILILPGLIAGIFGVIFICAGVGWMYHEYGMVTGHYTLAATVILTFAGIYYSLKSKAWKRFSLEQSLQGKANDLNELGIKEGDEGISVSSLRPMGTVLIGNNKIEGQSNGEFINSGEKIRVVKLLNYKVLVQKI